MKTATYTLIDGQRKSFDYDETWPCILCGLPVVEASMGGPGICPWCDMGFNRQGDQIVRSRIHSQAEYEAEVAARWPTTLTTLDQ